MNVEQLTEDLGRLTAERFLQEHGHRLMLALRMAKCTSQRDIDNPDCPPGIRRIAKEDLEVWEILHAVINKHRA